MDKGVDFIQQESDPKKQEQGVRRRGREMKAVKMCKVHDPNNTNQWIKQEISIET